MEERTAVFNVSLVIKFDWFYYFFNHTKSILPLKEDHFFNESPTTHHPVFDVYNMYIVSVKKIKIKFKNSK